MPRQPAGLGAAFLCGALDRRPPGGREHRGHGEQRQQHQRGMDRHQQGYRHAEAQDPPERREQGHVQVVEHEDLIAEHREAVEIIRPLVMGDGPHGCLQAGDVRFERDGDLVAKAPLYPGADRAQEPGRGGRDPQSDGRRADEAGPPGSHALSQQHQPHREQRVRQRRELRENEGPRHQARFVPEPEPGEPPHRCQRRRQVIDRAHDRHRAGVR